MKCGGGNYYYQPKFSPEKIESFFYMLRFIKQENFILRDKHTNFDVSEVLQYENGRYKSEHEFVNTLIILADLNNDCFNYNKNALRTLSFHDLLIQLFSRTNMLSHISVESDSLLPRYTKYIAEELFKNYNFIGYLCSNIKKYIHNSLEFKFKEYPVNITGTYRPTLKMRFNYIEYNLNYIPHVSSLKHELENLDLNNFVTALLDEQSTEMTETFNIVVNFKLNKDSNIIKNSNKFTLEHLSSIVFNKDNHLDISFKIS